MRPTNGTYYRNGTGTTSLTIDFPKNQGTCLVDGHTAVAMHWTNSGGFDQLNGVANCTGASTTHPPTGCHETLTSFTLTDS